MDREWYQQLAKISGVAADIGGVPTTHINHLTPRVLDIDDLYARMSALGIAMIDEVQGPPRWEGPDVLLRQTSFKALAEPRKFREPDGSVVEGELSVRFGEVEQRGIALTQAGRDLYDRLIAEIDERSVGMSADERNDVKLEVWRREWPTDEDGLAERGLAWFEWEREGDEVVRSPIVYEDFLPRSAAGIFASNLNDQGESDASEEGSHRDQEWMEASIGRTVHDPMELYRAQSEASRARVGE